MECRIKAVDQNRRRLGSYGWTVGPLDYREHIAEMQWAAGIAKVDAGLEYPGGG